MTSASLAAFDPARAPPSPTLAPVLALFGPLAAAAVVSVLPGLLLARALGLAWRWAPVVAPALSAAVLGGWAALGGPVGWTGAALATVAALATALAVRALAGRRASRAGAVTTLFGRPPARPPGRTVGTGRRTGLVLAAGGAMLAAASLSTLLARAGAVPGAVNQLWDAAWHANLTRFVVDTGDGRLAAAGRLVGAGWRPGESWYPSGLHVQAALVERATGSGVSTSLHAVVGLHAVLALPVVLAALVWVLSGELGARGGRALDPCARGVGAGVGAVVGVLPTAFPLDRVWRPAWPMTVGFVLALVAVLALVVCAGAARRRELPPVSAVAIPVVSLVGVGLVHPSGVVVAVLLAGGWVTGRALARRGPARTRALLAVAAAAASAAGVTVLARDHVDAVGSVFAYDYRLEQGLGPALASVVGLSAPIVPGTGYGVPQDAGQPLAGALLVVGALACAATPGARWLAGLWLVLVAAALETFTHLAAPLTLVTGWFFNVESRLVALVSLVGALAVGVGVASGASRLLERPVRPDAAARPAGGRAPAATLVRVITLPETGASLARLAAGVPVGAVVGPSASAGPPVTVRAGLVAAPSPSASAPVRVPALLAVVPDESAPRTPTPPRDGPAPRPAPRSRGRVLLGGAAAALAVVLIAIGLSSAERAQPRVRAAWSERVVGSDARAVMDALARQPLPPGGRVLNDPLDGSPWLYALTGTMPMFTHYDARDPRGDAATLLEGLDRADTDRRVRAALDALSVCYVYDAPTLVSAKERRPDGFEDLAGVAALDPVARSGDVVAYAVVPPPPGCTAR